MRISQKPYWINNIVPIYFIFMIFKITKHLEKLGFSYSVKPIPKGNIDRVIEMVTNLEEVDNVGRIIRLLG